MLIFGGCIPIGFDLFFGCFCCNLYHSKSLQNPPIWETVHVTSSKHRFQAHPSPRGSKLMSHTYISSQVPWVHSQKNGGCLQHNFPFIYCLGWIFSTKKNRRWWEMLGILGDLGGGNSNIFGIFTPNFGEGLPFWRAYFSNGLVQPPTSDVEWHPHLGIVDGFRRHFQDVGQERSWWNQAAGKE